MFRYTIVFWVCVPWFIRVPYHSPVFLGFLLPHLKTTPVASRGTLVARFFFVLFGPPFDGTYRRCELRHAMEVDVLSPLN